MMDGLTMGSVIRRAATLHPQRTAITYEGERYTYRQYNERVNRAAHALSGLGVEFGDHVAILGRNSIQYLELSHACAKLGAVFGTINWRLAPREVSFIVTDGDSKILVVEAGFQDLLRPVLDELAGITLVVFDGPATLPGALDYDAVTAQAGTAEPDVDVNSDDEALIMYTSGTTGLPKGAVLVHGNICWDAMSYLTYATPQTTDSALVSMPMNHVSGLHMIVNAFFVRGLPIVVMRQWDPEQACQLIEKYRITQACILVAPMQQLLDFPGLADYDLSSLRTVLTAAAKYDRAFPATVMHKLGLQHLWFAYGLTEASPMVTVTEYAGEMIEKENTLGRAVWYDDVRIVDDNDEELPVGEKGEIVVRGPNVFRGYYKRDDVNREVLRGGWLHTGDIGCVDEDGYLFFVDRKKDMIKSGGENVFSLEVEIGLLRANPELAEVAVVGVPHERLGEAVNAFVVLDPGYELTPEDLLSRAREHLAGYKLPKDVHFREELPKNVSGKVIKRQLRAEAVGESVIDVAAVGGADARHAGVRR
ncbi:MAG: long-chain-fatty-acid--CoA ligase [Pseudonocardiaceae bacterium]|nr:long-chain-fatty-acid--CoA ligase [Pseudonocardiaceae bacterium]